MPNYEAAISDPPAPVAKVKFSGADQHRAANKSTPSLYSLDSTIT